VGGGGYRWLLVVGCVGGCWRVLAGVGGCWRVLAGVRGWRCRLLAWAVLAATAAGRASVPSSRVPLPRSVPYWPRRVHSQADCGLVARGALPACAPRPLRSSRPLLPLCPLRPPRPPRPPRPLRPLCPMGRRGGRHDGISACAPPLETPCWAPPPLETPCWAPRTPVGRAGRVWTRPTQRPRAGRVWTRPTQRLTEAQSVTARRLPTAPCWALACWGPMSVAGCMLQRHRWPPAPAPAPSRASAMPAVEEANGPAAAKAHRLQGSLHPEPFRPASDRRASCRAWSSNAGQRPDDL
jgi:hypothetical protein